MAPARKEALYTCPEILDSHHFSLTYRSGQTDISMHSSLQNIY